MGLLSWLNDLFGSYEGYGTPSVTLTGQPVRSRAERVIADYFTRHTLPQELTPTLAVVEALAKGAAIGILSKWARPQQLTIAAERMERARGIIERRPLSFVLRCECYLQGFFSWTSVRPQFSRSFTARSEWSRASLAFPSARWAIAIFDSPVIRPNTSAKSSPIFDASEALCSAFCRFSFPPMFLRTVERSLSQSAMRSGALISFAWRSAWPSSSRACVRFPRLNCITPRSW